MLSAAGLKNCCVGTGFCDCLCSADRPRSPHGCHVRMCATPRTSPGIRSSAALVSVTDCDPYQKIPERTKHHQHPNPRAAQPPPTPSSATVIHLNSLVSVSTTLAQGLFAVHHASTGLLPQRLDLCCTDASCGCGGDAQRGTARQQEGHGSAHEHTPGLLPHGDNGHAKQLLCFCREQHQLFKPVMIVMHLSRTRRQIGTSQQTRIPTARAKQTAPAKTPTATAQSARPCYTALPGGGQTATGPCRPDSCCCVFRSAGSAAAHLLRTCHCCCCHDWVPAGPDWQLCLLQVLVSSHQVSNNRVDVTRVNCCAQGVRVQLSCQLSTDLDLHGQDDDASKQQRQQ